MGNFYPILEKEAIDYLCGLIRNITNITDSLDDLHVRTDGTFSSHKIDTLLQIILNEANEYTNQITSALVRITAEEMTEEPTLDNTTDKINTLIIYSPTGDTKYNQYLRLENKLIDFGPAEIDMSNVYTKEQANAKFALVTDIEGIIDVIGSENMGTTATTLKGAIKEVKETVDNIEPSVEISWAEYQALSEEEKNNGTLYTIPDMPVSTSGEIIGDVEYAEFYLPTEYVMVQGEYLPFELKSGNINITDGKFELKANKTYFIIMTTRPNDIVETNSPSLYSVALRNLNDLTSSYSLITTFHDYKDGRGEVPTSSTIITPSSNITIGAKITNLKGDYISLMGNQTKIIVTEIPTPTSIVNVTDEHIKEVATSLNCSWHTKDISLSSNLTEWGNESITVPEIINSKKVMLYDGTNEAWTSIFENIGEVMKVIYTNGLGVTDSYNFSQKIHIDFTNGKVMNISMRKLTSTGNPPNFTKIAYYK